MYFKAENNPDLKKIPERVGNVFPKIEKYYVRHSGLELINRENFKNLNCVNYLDLQDNQLTNIPSAVFDDLSSVDWIILTGNKISCIGDPFLGIKPFYIDFRNNTRINVLFYSAGSCNKYIHAACTNCVC